MLRAATELHGKSWAFMQEVLQGREPSTEDIDRLPYCTAVLLETLRRHPPAYMIGRCAVDTVALGSSGYTVGKGTTALIAPYLLHHSERWPSPESFDPDRWMALWQPGEAAVWRKALKGFGANGSYLPFGGVCASARLSRSLRLCWCWPWFCSAFGLCPQCPASRSLKLSLSSRCARAPL
jgi:cytochrome P450